MRIQKVTKWSLWNSNPMKSQSYKTKPHENAVLWKTFACVLKRLMLIRVLKLYLVYNPLSIHTLCWFNTIKRFQCYWTTKIESKQFSLFHYCRIHRFNEWKNCMIAKFKWIMTFTRLFVQTYVRMVWSSYVRNFILNDRKNIPFRFRFQHWEDSAFLIAGLILNNGALIPCLPYLE